jgi:ABC-type lipoprotein export system ATPase subunit
MTCVLIEALSIPGGQKSRVAFAKITFKKPHIILLDEPSNHLVRKRPQFFFLVIFSRVVVSSEEVKIIRTELWYSGVAGSGRS